MFLYYLSYHSVRKIWQKISTTFTLQTSVVIQFWELKIISSSACSLKIPLIGFYWFFCSSFSFLKDQLSQKSQSYNSFSFQGPEITRYLGMIPGFVPVLCRITRWCYGEVHLGLNLFRHQCTKACACIDIYTCFHMLRSPVKPGQPWGWSQCANSHWDHADQACS